MRWVKRILGLVLVLGFVATVLLIYTVRHPFPKVDGEIEVAGLNSTVEVIRDEWGVPHIYADNTHDLFFAQGYTHAQDRFWQMDFWRHIGAGRLSEMFGESQLGTDKFLRSLDLTGLARQELDEMPAESKEILESYAAGVNAYLEGRSNRSVALEYVILGLQNSGYQIEAWEPVHTLTWAKLMSWDLSGNMAEEIDRTVLAAILPESRVEELYPPFPTDHPYIVPSGLLQVDQIQEAAESVAKFPIDVPQQAIRHLEEVGRAAANLWALTGGGFEGIGSNNWVLAGSRTDTGMPILANDTHLSIQMPAIWYSNGIHCVEVGPACPIDAVGFSFPGVPAVVIGHNQKIAWGVTTQSVDTQDLFIERVNGSGQYLVNDEWVDFEVRDEIIRVAGSDPVEMRVEVSRHGPIVSGTLIDEDEFDGSPVVDLSETYAIALAWETLRPSTLVEAVLGLNLAQNYDQFREAATKWDIAAQNLIYADVEGNIAYQSTGRVPVRRTGDGRYPVPGWVDDYGWEGTVPFEQMPALFNPESGFIVTANQYVIASDSLPFLTGDGGHGYRAARIVDVLGVASNHSVASMAELQFDSRDGGAALIAPYLLEVDSDRGDVAEIQDELRDWSGGADPFQTWGDSGGAAAYQSTWRHLLKNLFHDELPEERQPYGGGRWFTVVSNLLEDPDNAYWDDQSTAQIESRDEILVRAMADAHQELGELFRNREQWEWGRMHTALFRHQTLGASGIAPIEWLFNRSAPPRVSGSASIVNANGWNAAVGYEIDWIASQRVVVDLADFDGSTFLHTTGQSGHAFNRHYADMIEPWTDGVQAEMNWTRQRVEEVERTRLTLLPG